MSNQKRDAEQYCTKVNGLACSKTAHKRTIRQTVRSAAGTAFVAATATVHIGAGVREPHASILVADTLQKISRVVGARPYFPHGLQQANTNRKRKMMGLRRRQDKNGAVRNQNTIGNSDPTNIGQSVLPPNILSL